MKLRTLLPTALVFFLPTFVQASVAISEVSWMGSSVSANHEWIELHNTGGESVSVEGWTLTDSNALSITLAGSVAPGAYAVLERTSDESAPGSAFLIYTGALVNTGTTLTLRDADNAIVDQIAGGENWESIGGDNTTKDTAQYSGTKWVTAPATPGRVNATVSATNPSSTIGSTNTSQTSSGRLLKLPEKETPKLELANVTLALEVEAPDIVYVGQRIPMNAVASGPNQVVLDSLVFDWNYGDVATGGGRRTSHRYRYAGEYVVTVHAAYGRHEQVARATVTVLPVSVSLTTDSEGNVQVHNDAQYEVLLGGFALSGARTVVFPPRTVLLPRGTITIPRERVGASVGSTITLRDPGGKVVVNNLDGEEAVDETMVFYETETVLLDEADTAMPVAVSAEGDERSFAFAEPAFAAVVPVAEAAMRAEEDSEADVIQAVPQRTTDQRSFLGLIALFGVAILALYYGKSQRTSAQ